MNAHSLIAVLFMSSVLAHSAAITQVTCRAVSPAAGVLVDIVTNATACSATGDAPGKPGLPGYRVSASALPGPVHSGTLMTQSINGTWLNAQDITVVNAVAEIFDTNLITWVGSGLATMRLEMVATSLSTDKSGLLSVTVDGLMRDIFIPTTPFEIVAQLDYTVDLSLAVAMDLYAISPYGAHNGDSGRSGFRYNLRRIRMYDDLGQQMPGLEGLGEDGLSYLSAFAPGDTSTGPVITSHTPEPAGFVLMSIALCGLVAIRRKLIR